VIEHRVAVLLARMHQAKLQRELGFTTVVEYAEHYLDLTRRQARELLHIGVMLQDFPKVDAAFAEGKIGWTKAREILRVATPDTEDAWIGRAISVSSRVLEDQVMRSVRGDLPPQDGDRRREPQRRRVTFEMSSADANVLYAALAMLRQQSNVGHADIEDGRLLASLAARVLREAEEGPSPATGERYRILVEHCPNCGTTEGANEDLAQEVVEEAQCDAEVVDLRPGPRHGRESRTIPPALRRAVLARDRWTCVVPGCTNRVYLDLHHVVPWSEGGRHTLAHLAAICTTHHAMLHAGQMSMGREGDTLWFEFPDGRSVRIHHPAHPDSRESGSAPDVEDKIPVPDPNKAEEDPATSLL
jgi:hypothetical protein